VRQNFGVGITARKSPKFHFFDPVVHVRPERAISMSGEADRQAKPEPGKPRRRSGGGTA